VWSDSARPVPTDKLHVTLHFIGPVVRERVPQVVAGLGVTFDPFDLRFGAHALWQNGVAALEPSESSEPLATLHRALAARLRALDLPIEQRRHRPHVTMARDASGSSAPSAASFVLRVREYVLVESRPGGRYVPLALFPAAS
jgi:RNA 2',3'-cyclic 3'-phosphodiesterase